MTTRLARALVSTAGLLILTAGAGPAFAQGPAAVTASRRLVASIGAASMSPLHADDETEGAPAIGSLALRLTPHGWLELEVTHRALTNTRDELNVVLPIEVTPISGTVGHADRRVFTSHTADWTAGANFIGRSRGRYVSISGGGGVVMHRESSASDLVLTNCVPPSASPNGFACRGFSQRAKSVNAGLQALGGVDVRVAPRVQAYVSARYELRADLAMGSFGIGAGVRVALK